MAQVKFRIMVGYGGDESTILPFARMICLHRSQSATRGKTPAIQSEFCVLSAIDLVMLCEMARSGIGNLLRERLMILPHAQHPGLDRCVNPAFDVAFDKFL